MRFILLIFFQVSLCFAPELYPMQGSEPKIVVVYVEPASDSSASSAMIVFNIHDDSPSVTRPEAFSPSSPDFQSPLFCPRTDVNSEAELADRCSSQALLKSGIAIGTCSTFLALWIWFFGS